MSDITLLHEFNKSSLATDVARNIHFVGLNDVLIIRTLQRIFDQSPTEVYRIKTTKNTSIQVTPQF